MRATANAVSTTESSVKSTLHVNFYMRKLNDTKISFLWLIENNFVETKIEIELSEVVIRENDETQRMARVFQKKERAKKRRKEERKEEVTKTNREE